MKNNIATRIFFLSIALLICFSSCDNDDTQLEADRVSQLLTTGGTWNMQSVTVSSTDQTALYSGLQISFTEAAYTSVNGGTIWPASGTWEFTNETATVIKRNDGVMIALNEVTEKKLVMSFTWDKTTLGSGRVNSISGQHVFTFTRP